MLNKIILSKTGMTLEYIQKTPLDMLRKMFEKKNNASMKIIKNELNIISHEEVEKEFGEAIED